MTPTSVSAGRGWGWIAEGWGLFTQAPGLWIVMLLIYFAINLVLSFIPFIGMVGTTLLTPALVGGMLYGADALTRGEGLAIGHLFQGLQGERTGPMLTLGALLLGVYILMVLLIMAIIFGGALGGGALSGNLSDDEITALIAGSSLVILLFVLVISFAIGMGFFYAIPLVMLGGQAPWHSIKTSFSACWSNILPLLVFGLIYIVFSLLAVIPIGLGLLVLLPVMFCAMYVSYREVFPEQDAHEPLSPSLIKR